MSSSSSSMGRQVSALVRRYAIFIARRPINSLIRLLVWPGVLFGLCLWVLNDSTDDDDSIKYISKSVFASGVAPILLLTTAPHVYSFCEYFVKDKATGFKSLMISMGLRRASYHSANAICMLLLLLPLTTIIAVISKIYIFDYSHSSTMTIILMFTLFTVQLISFTFALVSLITSTSYVALVFIMFALEPTLDSATKSLVERSGDTWRPFILFSAGFSPYQSIRIFSDSYVVNKNDGTSDYQHDHVSQPTYLILIAMIFWSIATVFLAKCIKRVYLGRRKGLLANICLFMDKENNSYSELDEKQDEEMTKRSSVYFEKPARNRDVGIRVQRVTKTFEGVPAVSELSLEVYKGETTMLLGHNGAGKTTLMNIILGLLRPDTGSVTIKRGRGDGPAVGVCPQTSVLDDDLSVQQHVGLFVDIKSRLEGQERSEHMRQILEEVSLGPHADKRPGELSGGMKRKLSLAIATVGKSDVLILDEPSSGLDPDSRMFVWNAIRRYRRSRTVLLSSQHMEEADYLGDRIAIMSEGQVVCCGSSAFLKRTFGSGYKLRVECEASKKDSIMEHIKKFYPSARLDFDQTDQTESSALPTPNQPVDFVVELKSQNKSKDCEHHMIELLEDFEANTSNLGIKSFGLKSSSIEDVMLETSKCFAADTKESPSTRLNMTNGLIQMLTERGQHQITGGYILLSLIMKNIQTHLANWRTFVVFRLVAPAFGAWRAASYFNPTKWDGFFETHYTPKIFNTFLVFHFVYYPVLERSSKFKIVQLTSNVSYLSYWFSMALVDIFTVITNTAMVNVCFVIFSTAECVLSKWLVHAIISGASLLLGLSAMMFCYFLSTILSEPKSALGYTALLLNLGSVVEVVIILLKLCMPKEDLIWMDRINNYFFITLTPTEGFQYILYGLIAEGHVVPEHSNQPSETPKGPPPISYGFGALLVQIVVYSGLLFLVELQNYDLEWYSRASNLCCCLFGSRKSLLDQQRATDDDVMVETAKAGALIRNVHDAAHSLVAADISKSYYKQIPVVEGLSFRVKRGECFGLLGVNGAGKSSAFSVLIAESAPDSGKVWANGLYSHQSVSEYRQHLGYDPQQNPEISLSPYEALQLMARLRMVPEPRVPVIINSVLEVLDMSQHAHKSTSDLSGGTKRKLALGMALIGNPDLLALDEPTAGVDPVARRGIWRLLKTLRSQNSASIIISSHAMEECEAICDRISVMARGRLRCIGTFLHLRSKFAQGCTLKVQLGPPATSPSVSTSTSVSDSLGKKSGRKIHEPSGSSTDAGSGRRSSIEPIVSELRQRLDASIGADNVKLADRNLNSASFTIGDNRVRRSILFKIMRDFRQKHPNISYMINDSSLEDIFISIAKEQQELEAAS